MNRATLLAMPLIALGAVGCASTQGTAENPSSSIEPYRASQNADFFAPLTIHQAALISPMPRTESRFASAAYSATAPGNFLSLGAGDALGIRVHIAGRMIAHTSTTWDLTAVPTD